MLKKKKTIKAVETELYIVYDKGGSCSKPQPKKEALALYESWTRQGGRCTLYRAMPVEIELRVKE